HTDEENPCSTLRHTVLLSSQKAHMRCQPQGDHLLLDAYRKRALRGRKDPLDILDNEDPWTHNLRDPEWNPDEGSPNISVVAAAGSRKGLARRAGSKHVEPTASAGEDLFGDSFEIAWLREIFDHRDLPS